ncbi:MAG: trypsin-like peptidase domain-containing protein [Chitinophagales bacterium]|nr:trypsin-like peptidase domain-containing protein [Chitinophagales bacterium]
MKINYTALIVDDTRAHYSEISNLFETSFPEEASESNDLRLGIRLKLSKSSDNSDKKFGQKTIDRVLEKCNNVDILILDYELKPDEVGVNGKNFYQNFIKEHPRLEGTPVLFVTYEEKYLPDINKIVKEINTNGGRGAYCLKEFDEKQNFTEKFIDEFTLLAKSLIQNSLDKGNYSIGEITNGKTFVSEYQKKISLVKKSAQISDNVCILKKGECSATGFLLGESHILTAYHFIEEINGIEDLIINFNHVEDAPSVNKIDVQIDCISYFDADPNLDFAVLKLNSKIITFCSYNISESVLKNNKCHIIHHPVEINDDRKKDYKREADGWILDADPVLYKHNIHTYKGSSGAPIFNEEYELIAMHTRTNSPDGLQVNSCIPISKIMEKIEYLFNPQFLTEAQEKIKDNAFERLSLICTEFYTNKYNTITFDVHAHFFAFKYVPFKYILGKIFFSDLLSIFRRNKLNESYSISQQDNNLQVLDLSEAEIDQLQVSEEVGEKMLLNDINILIQEKDKNESFPGVTETSWDFIITYLKTKENILLEVYVNNYQLKDRNQHQLTVALMMDFEFGMNKPRKSFEQQMEELQKLSKEYPILPFFAVDPRRANLYDLFIKAFTDKDAPFFGVKCYPSLGFLPSDKRLDPIFRICAEKGIPITTHCGGEAISTNEEYIEFVNENGDRKQRKLQGKCRKDRAYYLNDPNHWRPVLENYPSLKINFAHFGSDNHWEESSHHNYHERIRDIIDLLKNPQYNCYTDFSYNIAGKPTIIQKLKTVLEEHPIIQDKIMYGTDFHVVLFERENLKKKQEHFKNELEVYFDKMTRVNPLKFLFDIDSPPTNTP